MRRILLALCLGHVVKAGIHLEIESQPISVGAGAVCHWYVGANDPFQFNLQVAWEGSATATTFATVTRTVGQGNGTATSGPLTFAGGYVISAMSLTGTLLSEIHFPVGLPGQGPSAPSSPLSLTTTTHISTETSSPTVVSDNATGGGAITSSDQTQTQTHPTSSITPTSKSNSNLSSVITKSVPTEVTTPTTSSSVQDSALNQTGVPLISTASRSSHTGVIVGSICAVVVVLSLLIGALWIRRTRSRRESINREATPYGAITSYDAEMSEPSPRADRATIFASQISPNLPSTAHDVPPSSSGAQGSFNTRFVQARSDKRPREQQAIEEEPDHPDRRRMREIEELLTEPEGSTSPSAASSDLITENSRLKATIQVLIGSSNMGQGSAESPPPYLTSPTSE
ncbi:hypothetical protein C8J56DRAFT_1170880 [Mycena floridula]|nr:hypothetical protein C8J56DRAFT_1170880 [Mycena floridula]